MLGGLGSAVAWPFQKLSRPIAAAIPSESMPGCVLDGELTEGPYYVDVEMMRQNITEGKLGLPLRLQIKVVDANTCAPLRDAALDIWHCDAGGVYSGFTAMGAGERMFGAGRHPGGTDSSGKPGPPPGPPPEAMSPGRKPKLDGTTFCRGIQLTDNNGLVEFNTLYPGWYAGRDTHIHLKVHFGGDSEGLKYRGGHVSHTGQLFFPDELSDQIAKLPPYADHHEERTQLAEDMVYDGHAAGCMLNLNPTNGSSVANGMLATITLGVNPKMVQAPERGPGGWPGPPPARPAG
jgi:protocatechuate 3,4-dioxygenase beta subunit